MSATGATDAVAHAYAATRALLHADDEAQVRQALIALCEALGASVVPADMDPIDAIPVDLSLGTAEPQVPVSADPHVRDQLRRFAIPAIEDARRVLERVLSTGRLTRQATRDALTGLWNRQSVDLTIDQLRSGDTLAIIDLDHFKLINDSHGHAAGDEVLLAFAEHLRTSLRAGDIAARHGGEEFVVILPGTTTATAEQVLERVRDTWATLAPFDITFSTGLARVDEVSSGVPSAGQAALRWADAALYQAKANGRDCIVSAP